MQVHVKLMGVLKAKTPDGGTLDLSDGATVQEALTLLDIPTARVQVVSINGTIEHDFDHALAPEDQLTVLAPVGGG